MLRPNYVRPDEHLKRTYIRRTTFVRTKKKTSTHLKIHLTT